jgi:SAM-dependent methyltransferase
VTAYDSWAAEYDAWSADMVDDIAWYVELARNASEPIVELAAGTGRVAIPIARQTGKRVIGIDSSAEMLAIARERAEREHVPLDLRRGDLRDFELEEPVDLVICPYRALLHLPSWREKLHTFERVAESLRSGGRFAWNAFVFDHAFAARVDGTTESQNGVVFTTRYAPGDNRVDLERDGLPTLSLWWATKSEWEGLIDAAGLEVEALYGGFKHEPFGDDSREFVWVTRKPG